MANSPPSGPLPPQQGLSMPSMATMFGLMSSGKPEKSTGIGINSSSDGGLAGTSSTTSRVVTLEEVGGEPNVQPVKPPMNERLRARAAKNAGGKKVQRKA